MCVWIGVRQVDNVLPIVDAMRDFVEFVDLNVVRRCLSSIFGVSQRISVVGVVAMDRAGKKK